jgi:response regulator RpfG family c-di-GMP phosphodiesterase
MDIISTELMHILIVDDESSICELLGQYLRKKAYNVTTASSGEEALEFIKNNRVNLVISDIKMPGMSGVDFLKHVKEIYPLTPVLLTTGFPTLDTAIEALKLGAYDYLTKPFHLEEISEKIKRALLNRKLEEDNVLFSKLVSLHEITKVLSSTLDLADLNAKFIHYSTKMVKADGSALMFIDPSGKLGITDTFGKDYTKEYFLKKTFLQSSKYVAKKGEPILLEQGISDLPDELLPVPADLQSFISFPLKTPSAILGVLHLVRRLGKPSFSDLDLEITNVLASQASIAIENVRLYSNIRDNYLKTIRAFALAVEAKDRYTHGHSENVMKYTVIVAKHLGLPDHELEQVKYAGLLHDIGKIGISEIILNKANKLTLQEFNEIKRHPELGANIIADVPFLKSLVPLVLHHHEFYNGEGYPAGISGNDIPYGARILSIADAYEAMTSNRPYRKALSQDIAFSILEKERGRQFDPEIVDAFLDILRSFNTDS